MTQASRRGLQAGESRHWFSIEEGSEKINAYLEQGAAEWTENGWEQFTCRTAVLGCCSGFYLSIVNKKDL